MKGANVCSCSLDIINSCDTFSRSAMIAILKEKNARIIELKAKIEEYNSDFQNLVSAVNKMTCCVCEQSKLQCFCNDREFCR